ncbi:unnamed protein product [Nesidiocoris tenuis]|uniref:SUMO-activating enzyme subunit n=1 Tax=Nesidiocoris tenuis TaxID=355587 RepID=A0A6H5FYD0_9HEMI|nr:unnamed protein product [Nesidiocoris tenuis]
MALTCISSDLRGKIKSSKVLVVGAGGIGCELLKNLVFTGFEDIEVIDLDTIDVSNLNRQFLFQRQHVGRPKAKVAEESCLKFNPNVKIKSHCANIMNKDYGISYFSQFNLVLNALDNRAARAHVNRMCLGANVPLIDSGTSGYKGQVELIYRGLTLCYECTPKEAPKTFPACTIRTTPTEHIHCIIWSKYLFTSLFGGVSEDEEDVATVSAENGGDGDGSGDKSNAEEKLAEGENLVWDKDDEPAMNFVAATANIRAHVYGIPLKSKFEIKGEFESDPFLGRFNKYVLRFQFFDFFLQKDFPFFHRLTFSNVSAMAGNIIPAIATSNACIAGLIVLFALKVLDGKLEQCKTVYLQQELNSRGALITPETVFTPRNPNCFVCSSQSINLVTDISKLTIRDLEKSVLKGRLSMVEPEVMLDQRIIISSEEGETDGISNQSLQDVGVISGSLLKVEDFVQNYEIKIVIVHK